MLHPCRAYAELALHYILRIANGLIRMPLNESQEQAYAHAELPPPMIPGNWEPATPSCFFSEKFRSTFTETKVCVEVSWGVRCEKAVR